MCEVCKASGAFTNREFVGIAYYHHQLQGTTDRFKRGLFNYARIFFDKLEDAIKSRRDAITFSELKLQVILFLLYDFIYLFNRLKIFNV